LSIKKDKIFFRYKTTYGVLELYRNNEMIYPTDDNKTLAQTDGRDRIVNNEKINNFIILKIIFVFTGNNSSLGSTSKSNRFKW
jgi:hypothetical protein